MADVVLKRHCKLLSFFYNYKRTFRKLLFTFAYRQAAAKWRWCSAAGKVRWRLALHVTFVLLNITLLVGVGLRLT